MVPGHAGEVAERGAGGHEDGVDVVLLHEVAGEIEAGLAFVFSDGDDVFRAICESEDGFGEGCGLTGRRCGGVGGLGGGFLGVEGERGRCGGGGEQEASAGEHRGIVGLGRAGAVMWQVHSILLR